MPQMEAIFNEFLQPLKDNLIEDYDIAITWLRNDVYTH